jgi:DNA-binding beta-propeller fold protein YncE
VVGETGIEVMAVATEKVIHRIPLSQPGGAAFSADGAWLYVGTLAGDLYFINTATRKVDSLHIGEAAGGMALTADGRTLYVAARFSGLQRVEIAKRQVFSMASMVCPVNVALAPDGRRLYVDYQCKGPGGSPGHDSIDVIDTATGTSIGAITGLPHVGSSLAISPDGSQLWVPAHDACIAAEYDHAGCPVVPGYAISVLRTSDNKVVRTLGFQVGEYASGPWFLPGDSRVLLGGSALQLFSSASLHAVEVLPFASSGVVAFSPDRARAYAILYTEVSQPDSTGRRLPPILGKRRIAVLDLMPDKCSPPPPGMVAFWTGDGTANDVHGDTHALLENGAGFAPGLVGQAFQFDGVDDSASVPGIGTIDVRGQFAFSAWVKTAAGPSGPQSSYIAELASPELGSTGWQLFIDGSNSIVSCMTQRASESSRPTVCVRTRAVVQTGAWQHIVMVRNATQSDIYVNGRLEASSPGPAPGFSAMRRPQLRLGSRLESGSFFRGLLDEVSFYNRALQPDEVQRLFAARERGTCY